MYQYPLAVSNAVRDVRTNIVAMHRSMKDVAMAETAGQIESAAALVDQSEQDVYAGFDLIHDRFLGDKSEVDASRQVFADWKPIRDEIFHLMAQGKREEAASITKGKGADHVLKMERSIHRASDFAENKATTLRSDALDSAGNAVKLMAALLAGLVLGSIVVYLFLSRGITNPLNHIIASIRHISSGDLDHKIALHGNDEIAQLARAFDEMTDNLRTSTTSIARLTDVIRERKEAEEALQFTRLAIEHASDMILWIRPDGGISDANRVCLDTLGYESKEMRQVPIWQIDETLSEDGWQSLWLAMKEGGSFSLETEARTSDGGLIPVEAKVSYLEYEGNECGFAIVRNVSERKAAEKELRKQHELIERILDSIPHPFYMIDPATYSIQMANKAAGFGDLLEESRCYELTHDRNSPCGEPDHPCPLDDVMKTSSSVTMEHVHTGKDGETRIVELRAHPLFDDSGKVKAVIEYALDITERKNAEAELVRSEERLRGVLESMSEGLVVADANGKIVLVNPAADSILGANEMNPGLDFRSKEFGISRPDKVSRFKPDELSLSRALQGESTDKVEQFIRNPANPEGRSFLTSGRPIRDENGTVTGGVIVLQEITGQKRLEEKLAQSQKMEAIGRLAGGIAHDFNNVLYAILGFTELAMDDVEKETRCFRSLQQAIEAGQRARDLVDQILLFSRQGEQERRPVELQTVLAETVSLLERTLPSTVEIQQTVDPDCPRIMANPTEVHQVIMNICTNASQAMSGKSGLLKIGLKEVGADPDTACKHEGGPCRKCVCLTVQDNGPGMDESTIRRVFDPYFTTKGVGEGTGMGLATAHGIVTALGGEIKVESVPGEGTRFEVLFPSCRGSSVDAGPDQSAQEPPGGREHVLFVDDEKAVVDVGRASLEALGYRVSPFSDSRKALEAFRADPERYDVVVTDQTMPGLIGSDLAGEMLRTRPDLPIILCTGYSKTLSREDAKAMGIGEYLLKPVMRNDLGRAVRRIVERETVKKG